MTSRMVNPFQKAINLLCPDPSEELLTMAAIAIRYISPIIRFESQYEFLIHEMQNGYCVSRHENNMNLLIHFHQSSWMTRFIVTFSKLHLQSSLCFLSRSPPGTLSPYKGENLGLEELLYS